MGKGCGLVAVFWVVVGYIFGKNRGVRVAILGANDVETKKRKTGSRWLWVFWYCRGYGCCWVLPVRRKMERGSSHGCSLIMSENDKEYSVWGDCV